MTGAGHLIGYLIGTFNVGAVFGRIFGVADNQQFKAMTVIAASALLIAVGVTSNAVTERILLPSDSTSHHAYKQSAGCNSGLGLAGSLSCSTAPPGSAKPTIVTNIQLRLRPPPTLMTAPTTPLATSAGLAPSLSLFSLLLHLLRLSFSRTSSGPLKAPSLSQVAANLPLGLLHPCPRTCNHYSWALQTSNQTS
jgi:hypothetical protein